MPRIRSLLTPASFALLFLLPGTGAAGPAEQTRARVEAAFPEHAAHVLGEQASRHFEADQGQLVARADRAGAHPSHAAALQPGEELHLALPADGRDPLTFELGDGTTILVTQVGLESPAISTGRAVAYTAPGTTAFWSAQEEEYKVWLLVDSPAPGPVARWLVAGGYPEQTDERIELLDEAGRSRITVIAPAAYAASGEPVEVFLTADPGTGLIELWLGRVPVSGPVLVDPVWVATDALNGARERFTATLLPDGRVLVAGGYYLSSVEIFDPKTAAWKADVAAWTTAPSMHYMREFHTATLLRDGRVLVVGGRSGSDVTGTAEIYTPNAAGGSWSDTSSLFEPRMHHTATLLHDGRVLVAGGSGNWWPAHEEIWDPASGQWTQTGRLLQQRDHHAASILPDGTVLVTGGFGVSSVLSSTERFDLGTGAWTSAGALTNARYLHTATLAPDGNVVVVGGYHYPSYTYPMNIEIYQGGSIWAAGGSLLRGRSMHTTTILPNGMLLIVGGGNQWGPTTAVESYEQGQPTSTDMAPLPIGRDSHTTVLLADSRVLVAGGYGGSDTLSSAYLYDQLNGSWTQPAQQMQAVHDTHTATVLQDCRILVTGGYYRSTASELRTPGDGYWSSTAALLPGRHEHTATLLSSGKVLVTGGNSTQMNSCRLFNPAGYWEDAPFLLTGRRAHTATLLEDGTVLVAGGNSGAAATSSSEVYDGAAWTTTSYPMSYSRQYHTATLMKDGRVLVVGGHNTMNGYLNSSEIYDPANDDWEMVGDALSVPRAYHQAVLLTDGQVLVAGGINSNGYLSSIDIYDPTTGNWSVGQSMPFAARYHTLLTLLSGKVLVAGGYGSGQYLQRTALYDPAGNIWTELPQLSSRRGYATLTLLGDGRAILIGGYTGSATLKTCELFDEGRGALGPWKPVLDPLPAIVPLRSDLDVTGTRFTGISEASSGHTSSSPTNHPIPLLVRTDSGSVTNWPATSWTSTSAHFQVSDELQPGPAWLYLVSNAIPGEARSTVITWPTCDDGVRSDPETDVDCGGGSCPTCPDGAACLAGSDCDSGMCESGICIDCDDLVQNGDESDVDCGGVCPGCEDGKHCNTSDDCESKVCSGEICQAPSCTDDVKNGAETGTDCGHVCEPCGDGEACGTGADCLSRSCSGGFCQASCSDGILNQNEGPYADCGGSCPTSCGDVRTPVVAAIDPTIIPVVESIYTGLYDEDEIGDPVQLPLPGGGPIVLDPKRRSLVGGSVRTLHHDPTPLPGVQITVLDHPEFGQTHTASDGRFFLVVNGGEQIVLRYRKPGYLPVDRSLTVPWRQTYVLPEVAMGAYTTDGGAAAAIPLDPATGVLMSWVAAESIPCLDEGGLRRAAVIF